MDTLAMAQCPRWLRAFFHIIGMLWILLGDHLQFLRLCLRFPTALAAENLFLRKQLALYQERHVTPQPPVSPSLGSAIGLTGDRLSSLCSQRPCSAGIARDFACSGDGSHNEDGHRSRRMCKRLSARWHVRIPRGGRNVSRTNSSSSWGCGCHCARYANISRSTSPRDQANGCRLSAGSPLCATMPRRSS